FKGQVVWVRVDPRGKPVLDSDGRAEMKYRPDDTRVYRPATANLLPPDPAEVAVLEDEPAPARARAAADGEPATRSDPPSANAARRSATPAADAGRRIDVWTDGACSGNPGPMGIGVVVIFDGKRRE